MFNLLRVLLLSHSESFIAVQQSSGGRIGVGGH